MSRFDPGPPLLFSAKGCRPCQAVKGWLASRDGEGAQHAPSRNDAPRGELIVGGVRVKDFEDDRDEYAAFYRAHRRRIHRGPNGVEFPVAWVDGEVAQGAGSVLARLVAGDRLERAVTRSRRLRGHVDGLHAGRVSPGDDDLFLEVLAGLVDGGLETHVDTDGHRPALLATALDRGLVTHLDLHLTSGSHGAPDASEEDRAMAALLVTRHPRHRVRVPDEGHPPAASITAIARVWKRAGLPADTPVQLVAPVADSAGEAGAEAALATLRSVFARAELVNADVVEN